MTAITKTLAVKLEQVEAALTHEESRSAMLEAELVAVTAARDRAHDLYRQQALVMMNLRAENTRLTGITNGTTL